MLDHAGGQSTAHHACLHPPHLPAPSLSMQAVQAIETTSGDWASVDARIAQAEADSAVLAEQLQKADRQHQVAAHPAWPAHAQLAACAAG